MKKLLPLFLILVLLLSACGAGAGNSDSQAASGEPSAQTADRTAETNTETSTQTNTETNTASETTDHTVITFSGSDVRISGPMLSPLYCAKKIGADYIHPAYILVNRALVMLAHKLGLGVNVWTVDDPEDGARYVKCGVDFITSNILE